MLSSERRTQLDEIVMKMSEQNAPQADVQNIVNDFKSKYENESDINLKEGPIDNRSFGRKALDFVSSVGKVGDDITQAIAAPLYQKEADENNKRYMQAGDSYMKMAKNTTDPKKREKMINLAEKAYDQAGRGIQDILGGEIKTSGQVVGDFAGLALDVATAGTYGAAAKTAVSGQLLKPLTNTVPTVVSKLSSAGLKEAGKKVAVGAGIGYGFDVTNNLQQGKEGFEALTPGYGMLIGGALPIVGYGYGATKEMIKGKPLETVVRRGMEKGIRPSVAGKGTVNQMDDYYAKSSDAVKAIINNKPNLTLANKYGEEIVGELPDTLDEFASAIAQTKKTIFNEYDALTKKTGAQGAVITFDNVMPELQKAIDDPVLNLKDPSVANYAKEMMDRFQNLKSLTPEQTQEFIQQLNADLQSFYKNPTYGSASKVGIDAMIANQMREALDNIILTTTGDEYQGLKKLYGALRSIEKDVNHRALIDARKSNAGLIDFTNIFTYGDIASGIASGNPMQVARGTIGKAAQMWYKHRNDPNNIIRKMFNQAEKSIKNNVKQLPQQLDDNTNWINKMFPQEGKEAPKEVLNTVINKTKNMPAGLSIKDISEISKKKIDKTSIEQDLVSQAKKMKSEGKSFNEFVNNNYRGENPNTMYLDRNIKELNNAGIKVSSPDDVITLYHGTNAKGIKGIGETGFNQGSYFATDRKAAEKFVGRDGKVLEVKVPVSDLGFVKVEQMAGTKGVIIQNISQLKNSGDGIHRTPSDFYQTKSQLTDIWNKANNKLSTVIDKSKKKSISPYKDLGEVSTKILGKLDGKTTVSKQFISDLTNSGDLKQQERDIIREVLERHSGDYRYHETNINNLESIKRSGLKATNGQYGRGVYFAKETGKNEASGTGLIFRTNTDNLKVLGYDEFPEQGWTSRSVPSGILEYSKDGGKNWFSINDKKIIDNIDVNKFAEDVKNELLPLKRKSLQDAGKKSGVSYGNRQRYESISLPPELRGNVANYSENIYESLVRTSAGNTHFDGSTDNYFGHTRIEDLPKEKNSKALGDFYSGKSGRPDSDLKKLKEGGTTRRIIEIQSDLYQKGNLERSTEIQGKYFDEADRLAHQKEISKLKQYANPTAHFRMLREELKQAAKDGKTKIQIPTGETAMKIEGLGEELNQFPFARIEDLADGIGKEITDRSNNKWIITDILGDGKFKALPKVQYDRIKNDSNYTFDIAEHNFNEIFDISGKVDTSNPIYKFYEKELGKYVSNKYGAKRIIDDKGVGWYEINVNPEWKNKPVEAFGKVFIPGALLGTKTLASKKDDEDKRLKIEGNKVTALNPLYYNKDGSEKKQETIISKQPEKKEVQQTIIDNKFDFKKGVAKIEQFGKETGDWMQFEESTIKDLQNRYGLSKDINHKDAIKNSKMYDEIVEVYKNKLEKENGLKSDYDKALWLWRPSWYKKYKGDVENIPDDEVVYIDGQKMKAKDVMKNRKRKLDELI